MSKEKSIRNVRFKLDFKFEVSKSKNISESFVYVICLFIISITFLDCMSNILNSCFDSKAYSLECFDYRTGIVDLIR